MDADVLKQLLAGEAASRPPGLDDGELRALGLVQDAGKVRLAPGFERLDQKLLNEGLSAQAQRRWPAVSVVPESGSTNAELLAMGASAVGSVLVAEYQSAGRGRRGRTWLSPIGRNIAVSAAVARIGSLSDMAGLSLVVGMAVADALRTLGLNSVALKWPNDLIVMHDKTSYKKLGGILVELQPITNASEPSVLGVIGIGLNIGGAQMVNASVDQALADIAELQPELRRHPVLIAVLNSLADYIEHWEVSGFEPMVSVYNLLHAFTGKLVSVSGPGKGVHGVVESVTASGELRLRTSGGQFVDVDAGEVSLRAHADTRK